DARGVWGTLGLIRAEGGRPFDGGDVARARRLGPVLATFLRRYVTGGPLVARTPSPPPGVLILGPDHAIRAVTPAVPAWDRHLTTRQRAPRWIALSFFAGLSALARTPAATPRVVGPAAAYGRWFSCHAELLDDGSGDVAIVVRTPTAVELLPSLSSWYGITARESEVVGHLLDGAAPKHVARRLDLSVHTVNDHLKSIFRKTGARGRDELIAAFNG
ncbi:MAG: helix-turn-helix transcriptional regulator, partial [Saccharothrix sp.]|nr:helix-turn-helix transcriptional regulator [Saccharothrix sp.]